MQFYESKQGKIAYTLKGSGAPNYLVVHNSGGNHEMMGDLGDFLSTKGTVLIPDLLGHGQSDAPEIPYKVDMFAQSLGDLVESVGMEEIIFIGLNYGANLGIALAQQAPSRVKRLILLEPPIFMEPWIAQAVEQQIEDLKHYRPEWPQEVVDEVIVKASAPKREIARRALEMTPPHVKISSFEHLLKWDQKHSFQFEIPTLLVQSSVPFCREERAHEHFSKLDVSRVFGSGPWVNLEVPDQLHPMIQRYLELST